MDVVQGKLVAFGIVGVGHVWHVTVQDVQDVKALIEQGNFEFNGREVSVTRLSQLAHALAPFLGSAGRCGDCS